MYSVKIYNDGEVRLSKYREIKPRYKQVDKEHKVDVYSGEVLRYSYCDARKASRQFENALTRSKRVINELSAKNAFDYLVTFTFNKNYVNRQNAKEVHATFKNIIKRLKYTYGAVSYLAVPEFHADQVSIHYHALVTFERKPKLHYKGRTKKGNRLYTFADDFKREDCFLTVEKLTNRQPIGYLTKYLTKTHDYPLYRRFMASRGLNRHRAIESCGGFNSAYGDGVMIKAVNARAMSCIWSKGKLATFSTRKRDSAAANAAAVDSSTYCIKDEKMIEAYRLYYDLVAILAEADIKCKREAAERRQNATECA